MSSMNYVVHQLQELGLSAEVHGETVYCEDIDLDFDRSHDGVHGVSRWFVETREEYAEVIRELHEDSLENQADLELAEIALEEESLANEATGPEEPWSYEEAMGHKLGEEPKEEPMTEKAESYSEDAPCHTQAGDHGEEIKPHFLGSPLDEARRWSDALRSPKEIAQAAEVDDQDRGGVPSPEAYITEMKQSLAVVVLVKGQRFVAPEGWRIKESRPSGKVMWYGSIYQDRKAENEARGAEFSLVRS